MARIFCVTSDMPGMLFPAVELSRRLARHGHQLIFSSPEPARATVDGAGIDFTPLEPGRHTEFLAADTASWWTRYRRRSERRQRALEALVSPNFESMLHRIAPDLLLIDGEMHPEILTALGSGVSVALLNSFVSIWRRPSLPPPHCTVTPGASWRGSRLGIWMLWRALDVRKQLRARRLAVRHVGCDRLSTLRQLARDRDVDLASETDTGQWLIPFTYRRLPVLTMHALEFEFPHQPPERVHYVGPMQLESRGESGAETIGQALADIYASCRDTERALIFAGFGSFLSTDLGLVRRLFEAVASRSDWVMVLSLGGRLSPAALGETPENVHAFEWLPQVEVLRQASVAITHGGINTVDECVLAGVPSLTYCGYETDMAGTTARLAFHGLGLAGDRRDSVGTIERLIDRLLTEPGFQDNVRRFRQLYEAYEADQVAERAVDALLAAR